MSGCRHGGEEPRHPLLAELFAHPSSFTFVQATRLLHAFYGAGGRYEDFLRDRVRIRPHLSLAFPPCDVVSLERLYDDETGDESGEAGTAADAAAPPPRDREERPLFRLTVSILGLYGASSPLPTFYMEDLLAEAREDLHAGRDFLDLLNGPFYELFLHGGWFRYRPMQAVLEQHDDALAEKMLALGGLSDSFARVSPSPPLQLAAFTGLLNQFPRSAAGLQAFLSGCLHVRCTVEQCRPGRADIPRDQRCRLGESNGELGENALLGQEMSDCSGRIGIHLHDLSPGEMLYYTSAEGRRRILRHVNFYCTEPLDADLLLSLAETEGGGARLGSGPPAEASAYPPAVPPRGQRLGQDTWLGMEKTPRLHNGRNVRDEGPGTALLRGHRWQGEGRTPSDDAPPPGKH